MKAPLRSLLRLVGKGDRKVVAVFGFSPASCHRAVLYLSEGARGLPIFLFSTAEPLAETVPLCESVVVRGGSWSLLWEAERRLWAHWLAIGVATWTGERGHWPVKLAPLLVPPFRALLLNENGDFIPGSPREIIKHFRRRVHDAFDSGLHRAQDLGRGYWLLISYHVWRSAPVTRVKDEMAGVSLLLASLTLRVVTAVLGWFSLPRKGWFEKFHGNEPLEVPLPPVEGSTFANFVQAGAHWNRRKFEAFVRASDARWIVWHQDSSVDSPIDDMQPVLDDERTFAVSRQTHFRAWKGMLFPLAPFRTLQPGEASRVLAPVSRTVVVDRQKLLALGIPSCSLAGTAWMLLFWKAAAAGWQSYSMGQGSRLREQPDFPMQEMGFLLRIFWNRALRRLGPRESDLARGSIAFSPSHQKAAGTRPATAAPRLKVLVLAPFLPYPLSHGGAVRMFNLCRALAPRVDFLLVAIRESQDVVDYGRLHEVFREVYVVDKAERPSLDERLPDQVRQHRSSALPAMAGELARKWKPDLLQVEYTHLAALRDAVPHVPAILVEHDLTFSLYRQLAEKKGATEAATREYGRWLEFEKYWLGVYDGVWAVSEDDRRAAIREGNRSSARTFVVPNGVDIERFVPGDEAVPTPEIFYVGSFRHLPNVLGFQKLREEVMPRVWSRFPDLRLRVVAGPQHEQFWNRFSPRVASREFDSRIEIHGFVEDLRPLYAKASVVVVPLEVSAGTNIKVLEAMACGKAVVTTPIGCAGLGLQDGFDARIEGDWKAFADSVVELLADAALRRRISAQARRTVEGRFSWTAIAESAWQSYRMVAARSPETQAHKMMM
ncbi:MAG TPA: glycosyltransferase family 4 protein [Bryobacteraceae bacterium]